jgi:hypothetical protein
MSKAKKKNFVYGGFNIARAYGFIPEQKDVTDSILEYTGIGVNSKDIYVFIVRFNKIKGFEAKINALNPDRIDPDKMYRFTVLDVFAETKDLAGSVLESMVNRFGIESMSNKTRVKDYSPFLKQFLESSYKHIKKTKILEKEYLRNMLISN